MRTRQRFTTNTGYETGSFVKLQNYSYEKITDGKRPSPCNHVRVTPVSGYWGRFSGVDTFLYEYPLTTYEQAHGLALAKFNSQQFSLNRKKLNTTNEFGLLQFFAELDDTLALFTKKFWANLSYGSLTWGVLPFVNEMKSLLQFLANAEKSFGPGQRYEDKQTAVEKFPGITIAGGGVVDFDLKVTTRYSGYVTYPGSSEAQKWLDRLGLHPDINVAWDLLPLSFMVDWFLPVGDYIQSIHSSGWIRQVTFAGWCTTTLEGTCTLVDNPFASIKPDPLVSTIKGFDRVRFYGDLILKDTPQPVMTDISSKLITKPDGTPQDLGTVLKHLFDTAYLLTQKKR